MGHCGLLPAFMLEKQQWREMPIRRRAAARTARAESVACTAVAAGRGHGCIALNTGRLQAPPVLVP